MIETASFITAYLVYEHLNTALTGCSKGFYQDHRFTFTVAPGAFMVTSGCSGVRSQSQQHCMPSLWTSSKQRYQFHHTSQGTSLK